MDHQLPDDARFREAYGVVALAVARHFPGAEGVEEWGMLGWRWQRPTTEVPRPRVGTMDSDVVFIGLAHRKAGPTLHLWHPGAYTLLDDHADALKEAGFKVMRGCLPWTRKQPYPAQAVDALLRAARAVDG